jgi:hypothetical protein
VSLARSIRAQTDGARSNKKTNKCYSAHAKPSKANCEKIGLDYNKDKKKCVKPVRCPSCAAFLADERFLRFQKHPKKCPNGKHPILGQPKKCGSCGWVRRPSEAPLAPADRSRTVPTVPLRWPARLHQERQVHPHLPEEQARPAIARLGVVRVDATSRAMDSSLLFFQQLRLQRAASHGAAPLVHIPN